MNPETPLPGVIVWASRTGMTKLVCERVAEVLQSEGIEVEMIPAASYKEDPCLRPFLLAASPTYGSGDLHRDWDSLERDWRKADFSRLKAAALGCGSSRYPLPCGAVDILETRLRNQGALILIPSLRIDTLAGLRVRDCDSWAEALSGLLKDRI